MRISSLIFFSILFILVLFVITTVIYFRQSEQVRKNSEYLLHSTNIIRQSNRLQRNVLYMERGLRGYLLTGENYFVQSTDSAILENKVILKELFAAVPEESRQREHLLDIQALHDQWVNEYALPLRLAKARAKDSDSSLRAYNRLYREEQIVQEEEKINRQLGNAFAAFNKNEYEDREVRRQELFFSERNTKNISLSLTSLSIIVGLLIAVFLARHISSRIHKMVHMANEIAEGNYKVSMENQGSDELSHLANSLNHMAQVLEENFSLLQRKNKELDQFAHIVSHDLKAPLRGIDNVVGWIEEDYYPELPPKVVEYLELIKGRIRRSENLIGGILSYSRIGKEQQVNERVAVEELVAEILENTTLHSGIQVEVEKPLPVLYTKKYPLMQVFSNLISNAIKYSHKEGGRIVIRCREHEHHYEFSVLDNGPGIAKAYHDKIFVIFQTLQERDTFESTGVGLAIVKKILDDRKESIKVLSVPGEGAEFTFTWSK